MKWIVKCLRNYGNFKGRASRGEFWWFVLFGVIVGFVGMGFDFLLKCGFTTPSFYPGGMSVRPDIYIGGWFSWAFSLALLLPGLAVSVRRLHDTERSGSLLLIYWIGYVFVMGTMCVFLYNMESFVGRFSSPDGILGWSVGWFYIYGIMFRMIALMFAFLVWLCLPVDEGTNRYGIDPKNG